MLACSVPGAHGNDVERAVRAGLDVGAVPCELSPTAGGRRVARRPRRRPPRRRLHRPGRGRRLRARGQRRRAAPDPRRTGDRRGLRRRSARSPTTTSCSSRDPPRRQGRPGTAPALPRRRRAPVCRPAVGHTLVGASRGARPARGTRGRRPRRRRPRPAVLLLGEAGHRQDAARDRGGRRGARPTARAWWSCRLAVPRRDGVPPDPVPDRARAGIADDADAPDRLEHLASDLAILGLDSEPLVPLLAPLLGVRPRRATTPAPRTPGSSRRRCPPPRS